MAIKLKRKLQCLALGTAASMATIPAYAADEALLDMLLQNGAINQAQYDVLIEKETVSQKDLDDVQVKLNSKGLQFQTADKQFKFQIGGRIHADATFHGNDRSLVDNNGNPTEAKDGTELRRARMHFKGLLWDDFKFQTEVDFADEGVQIKDMFVQYLGIDWLELTVGNQKQAISMELQESSNDIMFTERSGIAALSAPFDRAIGINLKTKGHDWSAQIGAYGDGPKKNDTADEGWGTSARATYAPINTETDVIHLGAYGGFREPNEAGQQLNKASTFSLSHEASHMSSLKLSNTHSINKVKSYTLAGLEAAAMHGPFSVQAEYARAWVDVQENTTTDNTLDFDAWYVQAGWTLTGESRSYKGSDGEFKRLKADKHFSLKEGGGWGAVELAARYDKLDLNSDTVDGGTQSAVTVALNWYLNDNLRLMADYRRAFDVDGSTTTHDNGDQPEDIDMFTLRTQLAF